MEVKEVLEATIAEPITTPAQAERAGRAAALLAEYLRWEARASAAVTVAEVEPTPTGPGDLGRMTLHDAAEAVLEDASVPLHVRELGARIKARGWRHPRSANPRPDQILFQLAARLPRHPDRFNRVAPNTFGLTRWDDEPARRPSRRPRVGLFRSDGSVTGRTIGELGTDAGSSGEESRWRSS